MYRCCPRSLPLIFLSRVLQCAIGVAFLQVARAASRACVCFYYMFLAPSPLFLFDSGDAGKTPLMFSILNGFIRDRWATTLHVMEEKKCIRGIIRSTQQTRNQYASRWFTLAHSQLASDSSITNRIGHLAVQHYHLRFDLRVLTSAFRSIQLELCVSL